MKNVQFLDHPVSAI